MVIVNTFGFHINGIKKTFEVLFKGKFLIFFVPGLVITIIYLYMVYSARSYTPALNLATGYSIIDTVTGWLESGVSYFFSFIGMLFEQIYIYVVITLLSPFNTALAEKFDSSLTGKVFQTTFASFVNDFIRMIFVVIIAITLEFGIMLFYWMFSWIFPSIIDTIIYYLIAAFFFGFSFYDFHLERYKIGVLGSLGYAFQNILTMLLTGSFFLLIYNIPIIGIPLAPVLTIMVSTVVYLQKENKIDGNTMKKIESES